MKIHERILALVFLAASLLPAAGTGNLLPQGDWTLCDLGIQMPDCAYSQKRVYMLEVSGVRRASTWVVTGTLTDGSTVTLSGNVQPAGDGVQYILGLDFGGFVAHWSVTFSDVPQRGPAATRR